MDSILCVVLLVMSEQSLFENHFQYISSLIGEPARAIMLWRLLDGRAYTAGELATSSGISPQSASNHLNKLLSGKLVKIEKQGRYRYYKLAGDEVAYAIESMASLIPAEVRGISKQHDVVKSGVKYARTCYDHLAGTVGVQITKSLLELKIIVDKENTYEITSTGSQWFKSIEIDTNEVKLSRRSFVRKCLDWSEREHHIAGALGASMLSVFLKKDWVRRKSHSREVVITYSGKEHFDKLLKLRNL